MQNRNLLRKQLATAWKQTIKRRYSKQLINSERGLQCYFCAALLQQFKQKSGLPRRLFIEPRISVESTTVLYYPDIVICDSRKIIGVVELKYQPRVSPAFKNDLKKLQWIAQNPKGISIANDRYRGPQAAKKKYELADDAILCWSGVHQGCEENLKSFMSDDFHSRFMELHAITSENALPRVKIVS